MHTAAHVALLSRRRIHRERQKSIIYRVEGLDPPLGTRDPALLWPSVVATPAPTADSKHHPVSTPVNSQEADDSVVTKRPLSVASSSSTTSSANSMQPGPANSKTAASRTVIRSTFAGLKAPPAAVLAGTHSGHTVDKASSSNNSDCCITLNDVHSGRDQDHRQKLSRPTHALEQPAGCSSNSANVADDNDTGLRSAGLPQHPASSADVVRHWGRPIGHATNRTATVTAVCSSSSQGNVALQAMHVVVTPCGPSETLQEIVPTKTRTAGQQALCVQ